MSLRNPHRIQPKLPETLFHLQNRSQDASESQRTKEQLFRISRLAELGLFISPFVYFNPPKPVVGQEFRHKRRSSTVSRNILFVRPCAKLSCTCAMWRKIQVGKRIEILTTGENYILNSVMFLCSLIIAMFHRWKLRYVRLFLSFSPFLGIEIIKFLILEFSVYYV